MELNYHHDSMIGTNSLIFFILTFAIILLVERLEERVLASRYFRSYNEEMERVERELNEYYIYSLLAIAIKDKEAYYGFQSLASEKYWPFFFRKMLLNTSLFFLLLTPYMLFAHVFLNDFVSNAFSWVLFLAIAYFTLRLGLEFVKESINSWKNAKKYRRQLEET